MLVPKRILNGVIKAAATDTTRYQLCGIHLSRNGRARAQATDGKVLIRAEWDEDDWEQFPDMGTCPKPEDDFSVIIPSEQVKRLAKSVPKSSKPILENIAINELPSASVIQVGRTDLECSSNEKIPIVDAKFPDLDSMLGTMGPVEAEFTVDPVRMIQLMEAIIASSGETKRTWKGVVHAKVHGKGRPISFEHSTKGQTTTALVMPMVVKSK